MSSQKPRKRNWVLSDSDDDTRHADKRAKSAKTPSLADRLSQFSEKVTAQAVFDEEIGPLLEHLEKDNARSEAVRELCKCVYDMPQKMSAYGAVAGLVNAKCYIFGSELVEYTANRLVSLLMDKQWEDACITILFQCNLMNSHCVSSRSLFDLLKSLYVAAADESRIAPGRDYFLLCTLRALPWAGEQLHKDFEDELNTFLDDLEACVQSRNSKEYANLLKVWSANEPHPQEEMIDCLWAQLTQLKSSSWKDKHIMRYDKKYAMELRESVAHALPDISLPCLDDPLAYPLRTVVFRLFDYTDCPEGNSVMPGAHTIERHLIEQDLGWIIMKHIDDRVNCAKLLSRYWCRDWVPIAYVAVEVVFGMLFRLPTMMHAELAYESLLLQLCKAQVQVVPQTIAQATELLFQRLDSMAVACIDRFVNWFSFHLSNFRYCWNWDDWKPYCTHDPLSPHLFYISELIRRCQLLSYRDRLLTILPPPFHQMMPVDSNVQCKPRSDAPPMRQMEMALSEGLKHRCDARELLDICSTEFDDDVEDGMQEDATVTKMTTVFTMLLVTGAKTLSHTLSILTKYRIVLKELVERDERCAGRMLECLLDCWSHNQQRMVFVVSKLLRMELVSHAVVIDWIFSDCMKMEFLKQYVWEIMTMMLQELARELSEKREKARCLNSSSYEAGDQMKLKNNDLVPDNHHLIIEQLGTAADLYKSVIFSILQHFVTVMLKSENRKNSNWLRIASGRLCQILTSQWFELSHFAHELTPFLNINEHCEDFLKPVKWYLSLIC